MDRARIYLESLPGHLVSAVAEVLFLRNPTWYGSPHGAADDAKVILQTLALNGVIIPMTLEEVPALDQDISE